LAQNEVRADIFSGSLAVFQSAFSGTLGFAQFGGKFFYLIYLLSFYYLSNSTA